MLYSKYLNPFGLRKGRPKLSSSQRKTARIVVRFTKRQFNRLKAEADDEGISLGELVRRKTLQKRDDDSLGLEFLDRPRRRSSRRGASF